MNRRTKIAVALSVLSATSLLLFSLNAEAVPSYSRRYNVDCSTCHTVWGALNGAGNSFKMSGYRAIFGKDLKPVEQDTVLANGMLSVPMTFPASLITGAGVEYRSEKRTSSTGGTRNSEGASLALEDASIFLTSPIGKHLSMFIEFPMYETKAWEFTPTGPFEANNIAASKNIRFNAETPVFEVAKFWFNSILPEEVAPRDSVNFMAGITHPPLAYSPGKVRLSINQYPIYERRALDLISHKKVDDMLPGEVGDTLFRLSEPQILAEFNGMFVPGGAPTDTAKKETFWLQYNLGLTNGSNGKADNNPQKDFYGRLVARWYGQSLGFFGYYSADTYGDDIRNSATSTVASGNGIMSGKGGHNSSYRIGPDMTLSLVPFGIPLWLENQFMYNRESDPTGFGKEFKWMGGFHQLNWQPIKKGVAYARYDWVKGDKYDDTAVGGITNSKPSEWDVVAGVQYLILQNLKVAGEYRHHEFTDKAGAPVNANLTDNGFSTRFMIGF